MTKPGYGESFVALDDGALGPTIAVTKLADGYVAITIAEPGVGAVRVTIGDDLALRLAAAIERIAK